MTGPENTSRIEAAIAELSSEARKYADIASEIQSRIATLKAQDRAENSKWGRS